jgi:RNA polymerase sigma-70 factor (ECF subfamily)
MSTPSSNSPRSEPLAAEAGARDVFWELAERYRPYLKGIVGRLIGDRLSDKVDASDVVQQSLLAAFRQSGQFHGHSPEEWQAWLVAIVRNESLSMLRYWHQEMRDIDRERALAAASSGGFQPAAGGSSPSQQAARREQGTRLLAAIDRLPPDHRQVITLRNLEDLPYEAVAARMGRSEEAVRQLWVRAIERLRQELGSCA